MEFIENGIGLDIVEWFQSWGPQGLKLAMVPFHYLGGEYGYLLLIPVLYWCVDKEGAKRLLILALVAVVLNMFLKDIWARPRPFEVAPDRISAWVSQDGYGIPSGHTIFGTVLGGWVIWRVRRAWTTVVMVLFIIIMGVSRMVLGVHYPQDVVAGWLIGGCIVALFALLENPLTAWAELADLRLQIPLLVLLFSGATVLAFRQFSDPEALKDPLAVIGALVGAVFGMYIEERFSHAASGGAGWIRIFRALVGILSLAGIYLIATGIYYGIAGESTSYGISLLYLFRYCLLGVWVTFGAPALFVRVNLADQKR